MGIQPVQISTSAVRHAFMSISVAILATARVRSSEGEHCVESYTRQPVGNISACARPVKKVTKTRKRLTFCLLPDAGSPFRMLGSMASMSFTRSPKSLSLKLKTSCGEREGRKVSPWRSGFLLHHQCFPKAKKRFSFECPSWVNSTVTPSQTQ